tara:strand:- start:848 stop:1135 length:288 start_codon:yes stop_codon:yes gene_type:complete
MLRAIGIEDSPCVSKRHSFVICDTNRNPIKHSESFYIKNDETEHEIDVKSLTFFSDKSCSTTDAELEIIYNDKDKYIRVNNKKNIIFDRLKWFNI